MLLNSLVFIGIAFYRSIHGYIMLAQGRIEEKPGVYIAEGIDGIMIALFFVMFAMGISKLFLPNINFLKGYELPWLKVDNFSGLKYILWEVLLTTLFVVFVSRIIIVMEHLEWTILIIPASILMLAVAYKLLKQGH